MPGYYEEYEFPKALKIEKKYKDVQYEPYNIETAKMSDGYIYGVAENLDNGYMFWTRGRKKEIVIHNIKTQINRLHKREVADMKEKGWWNYNAFGTEFNDTMFRR